MVTLKNLEKLIGEEKAKVYFEPIIRACAKYEINSKNRFAYFLANVLHESGAFTVGAEKMKYSSLKRIQDVFKGSRSGLITSKLVNNEQLLANTMYGGDWGKKNLGNTEPNDGWHFRGRGALQTTGRDAYTRMSKKVFGDDRLVINPDLILEPFTSLECAAFEFKEKGCNELSDEQRFNSVVKKINGGLTNLEDRVNYLNKILNLK